MSVRFQLSKPDDLQATLLITMTVGEFRRLKKQLDPIPSWPLSDVSREITDVILQAEKVFYATEEAQP